MKRQITSILLTVLIVILSACSGVANAETDLQAATSALASSSSASTQQSAAATTVPISSDFDADDLSVSTESDSSTIIQLGGDSISVDGSGIDVSGTVATITAAGTYTIQGSLNDGQIVVDTQDTEAVVLILNGADITSSSSAPIYVANAEKTVITLAEGTQNSVSDTARSAPADESDEINAAIFSHDDLTINGSGALTVTANYNNGIASKDDLRIVSGTITVEAVNDGIKGKDSVSIKDGIITIGAGADGIQSTNAEETEKGYVLIEGGSIEIISGLDGIQAETSLLISDGEINITSGGGSANSSTTGGGIWGASGMQSNSNQSIVSAKGLKASVDITIDAGTIIIDSADDSVHSNASLTVNGGSLTLTSGDDGMHADAILTINQGEITINQSYEGIESGTITINDGTIHINASDDGINVAGGNDGSAMGGRPEQNQFADTGAYHLYINGGYVYVDANGDGIDTNGSFDMSGGVVLVNGPTNNGNGPLDYMGTFNITGGTLVAVGSSGMAQAPSNTSSQYAIMANFDSLQAAGSLVHIETQSGQEILTFQPTKEYQSVLLSSAVLQNGETYVFYTGGSSNGDATDGLFSVGAYISGTQITSLTVSAIVTSSGGMGGMMGGGRPGGGGGFGGAPPTRP